MRACRGWRSWATAVGVAAGLAVTGAPASAATFDGAHDAVVGYSDPGDWVGGGKQRLWRGSDSEITLTGDAGSASISVDGGPSRVDRTITVASPQGRPLGVGVYEGSERTPFRSAGHPGLDVYGDGRGCNTDAGRFEIRDIGRDASGAVDRLWMVYEQHCEGGQPATWGEIRLGMSAPAAGGPTVAPSVVRWPVGDVGQAGTTVPVTVVAGSAGLRVGSTGIGGDGAAAFRVVEDGCTAVVLAPGRACQVWVRQVAPVAGTQQATLRVTDAAGARHDTALQTWSYGGTTAFRMTGDAGDWITQGRSYAFVPATSRIAMTGTREGLSAAVTGHDGSWWYLTVAPRSGDILVGGRTYAGARRTTSRGTGAGLDVSGDGRGCNALSGQFTMDEARWYEEGSVRSAALRFEQHCEEGPTSARGSFEFRRGDRTPEAAWMTSSGTRTTLPTPPETVEPTPTTPTEPTPTTPTTPTEPTPTTPTEPTPTTPTEPTPTTPTEPTPTTPTEPTPTTPTETTPTGPTETTPTGPTETTPTGPGTPAAAAADGGPSGASGTGQGSAASPFRVLPAVPPPAPTAAASPASFPAAVPAGTSGPAAVPTAPLLSFDGLRAGRDLRFRVRVPAAGRLVVTPRVQIRGRDGRARTLTLGRARASVARRGTHAVTVRMSRTVRRAVAAHRVAPLTTSLVYRAPGAGAVRSQARDVLRMR